MHTAHLVLVEDLTPEGCPACGNPIDYCQGHGEIGDPIGFAMLAAHDEDDHRACHPDGCPEAPTFDRVQHGSLLDGSPLTEQAALRLVR